MKRKIISIKYVVKCYSHSVIGIIVAMFLLQFSCAAQQKVKLPILVCSGLGGTDPGDFQSIIHLLMYSNEFKIEGLVASPFGNGRKADLFKIIDLHEKNLPELKEHADGFPSAESLRKLCVQGGVLTKLRIKDLLRRQGDQNKLGRCDIRFTSS